ncbi:MAG: TetR/AcrR family transcriptional regulator [Dehalococcoidia bacterium]
MPHPARLGPHSVLAAARALLEERGLAALTMRELARRLGVQAPSLYFHVRDRDALLSELIDEGVRELGQRLDRAVKDSATTAGALLGMADAYCAFAGANPELISLMFGPCPDGQSPGFDPGAGAAAPLFATVSAAVPPADVAPLAQAYWALVHGFSMLANAGQFRLPGADPAIAMRRAVVALLDGWGRAEAPPGVSQMGFHK